VIEFIQPVEPEMQSHGSEQRDAIIRDLKLKKEISAEYLDDKQVEFMRQLNKNEALLEYYIKLKESIVSLFTLSKVVTTGKLKL
jgi:hypothetical protein